MRKIKGKVHINRKKKFSIRKGKRMRYLSFESAREELHRLGYSNQDIENEIARTGPTFMDDLYFGGGDY